MNDLISVVIPTYNRRDKLPACIASVLAQTYRNIEVIVVDDASTDGTERLFDRDTDPRVHYVRYGDNPRRVLCPQPRCATGTRQHPRLSGQRRSLAPGQAAKAV